MLDREPVNDEMDLVKPTPFLKWAGGKSKLLPSLAPLMPKRFNAYLEPFVGGGAMFFHVATERRPDRSVIIDSNRELIECYRVVQNDPVALIAALEAHRNHHLANPKDYYYHVRDEVNPAELSPVGRAARVIYMNKVCFNGLYRQNARGKFNVPLGSYKNPAIYDPANLLAVSRFLRGATIEPGDFARVLEFAEEGNFIYFDPPYFPISRTSSFTSYTAETFLEAEQTRLRDTVEELARRGCYVMLSNSDCTFIRDLYEGRPGLKVMTVQAPRSINCQGDKRGPVSEVVVLNYKCDTDAP